MIYVIVGFRVDTANSVYYGKAKDLDECLRKIRIAFEKHEAEFISLRKIEES